MALIVAFSPFAIRMDTDMVLFVFFSPFPFPVAIRINTDLALFLVFPLAVKIYKQLVLLVLPPFGTAKTDGYSCFRFVFFHLAWHRQMGSLRDR